MRKLKTELLKECNMLAEQKMFDLIRHNKEFFKQNKGLLNNKQLQSFHKEQFMIVKEQYMKNGKIVYFVDNNMQIIACFRGMNKIFSQFESIRKILDNTEKLLAVE